MSAMEPQVFQRSLNWEDSRAHIPLLWDAALTCLASLPFCMNGESTLARSLAAKLDVTAADLLKMDLSPSHGK